VAADNSTLTAGAVDVRGVTFAYPDGQPALRGVDLRIERGERVALLGPNGAGKTTLILHLDGSLCAGEGTVAVGGLPVRGGDVSELRRRVGIVHADPGDQLFMPTVGEDVAFGPASLGLRGDELNRRVSEAMAAAGIAQHRNRPQYRLSLGERRRVALATVLAARPEVLVLDEPSSSLDPVSRRELATVLRSLDVTLLVVTSDLPYALALCPRAVIIDGGRIVADGPTSELLADPGLMRAHRLELPAGFRLPSAPALTSRLGAY
jgi:cobalt/nickel transport system ATP-binding protein